MNPAFCASYKAEIMRGVHREIDTYMLALYTDKCDLTEFTTAYTPKGEASGDGYRAGGQALKGFRVEEDGSAACLTFDDALWDRATLRDVCYGLVYNASQGNRAVGIICLAQKTSSTNGPFEIYFPEATASDGVFVID